MGQPVVVVTTGGLPVTVAANGRGTPMEVAANGRGIPVRVVASGGLPVVGIVTGPDVTAPIITSSNTISQPENTALTHFLSANETVTWAKVGGADTAKFTLTGNTLTLPAKDYELPDDANADRAYIVQVQATDTAANPSAIQTITVTITDVSEATPPVVTYIGDAFPSGVGTTTITATGVDIGNPAYIATRRVIVVLSGGSEGVTITSGTINGVALDRFTTLALSASPGASNVVEFISAPVPTGTTGVTIVLNYAFSVFGTPRMGVFNVNNASLSSTLPVTAISAAPGPATGVHTLTVPTLAGGFILAAQWTGGGSGPSITASTATFTTDYSNSATMYAHANGVAANAASSVSTQAPPAGGSSTLALAAYR